MSAKKKGKWEDLAKVEEACDERGMKTYIPPKEETKKAAPMHPKRRLRPFPSFPEHRPPIKREHPGLATGDAAKPLGGMRKDSTADNEQPGEKAAELMGKYEKDTAAYCTTGKPDAAKTGVATDEKSKKKEEEEDDEEDEDEGE